MVDFLATRGRWCICEIIFLFNALTAALSCCSCNWHPYCTVKYNNKFTSWETLPFGDENIATSRLPPMTSVRRTWNRSSLHSRDRNAWQMRGVATSFSLPLALFLAIYPALDSLTFSVRLKYIAGVFGGEQEWKLSARE